MSTALATALISIATLYTATAIALDPFVSSAVWRRRAPQVDPRLRAESQRWFSVWPTFRLQGDLGGPWVPVDVRDQIESDDVRARWRTVQLVALLAGVVVAMMTAGLPVDRAVLLGMALLAVAALAALLSMGAEVRRAVRAVDRAYTESTGNPPRLGTGRGRRIDPEDHPISWYFRD